MTGEIWRRSKWLVVHLVSTVAEAGEPGEFLPRLVDDAARIRRPMPSTPAEWVGVGPDESAVVHPDRDGPRVEQWSTKTVENTVGDLCAFGVLRKVDRGRDRYVVATVLGRAWLAGVLLPGLDEWEAIAGVVGELLVDV